MAMEANSRRMVAVCRWRSDRVIAVGGEMLVRDATNPPASETECVLGRQLQYTTNLQRWTAPAKQNAASCLPRERRWRTMSLPSPGQEELAQDCRATTWQSFYVDLPSLYHVSADPSTPAESFSFPSDSWVSRQSTRRTLRFAWFSLQSPRS